MDNDQAIIELLRWRLERAEADAPPAPRARRLLELARPWWETWPERFRALAERLGQIQLDLAVGHAMSEPRRTGAGYAVPVLISRRGGGGGDAADDDEREASARVLYLGVRNGRLHLRFRLDDAGAGADEHARAFEVTFVGTSNGAAAQPMVAAHAARSLDSEYRLDAELPHEIAAEWARLKVTDRMPFRLILRADGGGGG